MTQFFVKIFAADKILYEGFAVSLRVPVYDGQMGILANHSNIISAIAPGMLTYRTNEESAPQKVAVSSGLLRVEGSNVLVLVNTAEKAEDIDLVRAKKAAERARAALAMEQSRREYANIELDLMRALNRIKVKNG